MTSTTSRRLRRSLLVTGLVLVPLAVVGLFAGATAAVGSEGSRVPAAIVNEDEFVTQTAADGTETQVLAGRLLVTQLTAGDPDDGAASSIFDWHVEGADEAEAALKAGEVYAVITIPSDFSKSVVSLSTDDPVQAQISLQTDDSHGYLTGPLTSALGDGLAAIFGTELSKQYIAGLVGGTGSIAGSLTEAADGATQLQTGARSLGDGLTQAAGGITQAQSGAGAVVDGLEQYTGGVSSLSSGLNTAASSSSGLQALPAGVSAYTGGVSQTATGLSDAIAAHNAGFISDAEFAAAVDSVSAGLNELSAQGPQLVAGAQGAAALQTGVVQSAAGASQLAAGGAPLVAGVEQLQSGLGDLSAGIGQSAAGANQLADGAGALATGLNEGAAQVPDYTESQVDQISDVASSPVGITASRENEVNNIPQIGSTLLVPVGLWIGALAVFLLLGAPTRRVLASTAGSARIAVDSLGKALGIVGVQAVALVALLHLAIGVPWESLPATLPFALLIGVAFAAIDAMLTTLFGRVGLVVSLVLLALQLTTTGGLYPIELLSEPFRIISPLLPVTGAVDGMQAIITGAGAGGVIAGALPLVVWGALSVIITFIAVARKRSARALGLVPHLA
ncbi:YhgE/Pip domain-containing protein [Amnibacterium flavum]|nr:YhgE/Pip family protein [Amnibacterium flavum]